MEKPVYKLNKWRTEKAYELASKALSREKEKEGEKK